MITKDTEDFHRSQSCVITLASKRLSWDFCIEIHFGKTITLLRGSITEVMECCSSMILQLERIIRERQWLRQSMDLDTEMF